MPFLYFGTSLLSLLSRVGKENAAGRERERQDSYNKNQRIFQSLTKTGFHFKNRELASTAVWKRCKN